MPVQTKQNLAGSPRYISSSARSLSVQDTLPPTGRHGQHAMGHVQRTFYAFNRLSTCVKLIKSGCTAFLCITLNLPNISTAQKKRGKEQKQKRRSRYRGIHFPRQTCFIPTEHLTHGALPVSSRTPRAHMTQHNIAVELVRQYEHFCFTMVLNQRATQYRPNTTCV